MNEPPILIHDVTRSFGKTPALQHLNLTVPQGSIYGFLGRNGTGKSTTLRMLAGLIKPQAGEVRILGLDPFTMTASQREQLGYMSERHMFSAYATVGTLLQLGERLYPAWDKDLVDQFLSRYHIKRNKGLMTLSQGNQRLVSFLLAVAPRPKVLLLDEPAANLDVVARREILADILELIRDFSCTVLFSTHIISDVERVADQVGILHEGKLRVSESLDHMKETIRRVRFYAFSRDLPKEIPGSFRIVRSQGEIVATLRAENEQAIQQLARQFGCSYEISPLSLEDIFVDLSRNSEGEIK